MKDGSLSLIHIRLSRIVVECDSLPWGWSQGQTPGQQRKRIKSFEIVWVLWIQESLTAKKDPWKSCRQPTEVFFSRVLKWRLSRKTFSLHEEEPCDHDTVWIKSQHAHYTGLSMQQTYQTSSFLPSDTKTLKPTSPSVGLDSVFAGRCPSVVNDTLEPRTHGSMHQRHLLSFMAQVTRSHSDALAQ